MLIALAMATPVAVAGSHCAEARGITFRSPQAALEQGLGAIKAGNVELAIPALEAAAPADGRTGFLAQFYLARIFADNGHAWTDHAKAYMLYQRIADEHADIDPDDDLRAPFVAKSLMALAQYLRHGVAEIGLKPNAQRAAEYVHHAATVFSHEDAQFEHAKLLMTGDGVDTDVRRAIHWFSVLSQRGHPGAQAFLADLYWRGRHVPKDQMRALALITLATENAPGHERIWIEDIYQNIFCGTSDMVRREANGVVADWRQKYTRAVEETPRFGLSLGLLSPNATRTCSDGRTVAPALRGVGFDAAGAAGLPQSVPVGGTAPAASGGGLIEQPASRPRDQ